MIWQENVNHIVLISSPNEEFVYYWPKLKNDVVRFDDIRVSIKEICYNKFYIHRKLQVQRKGKSRQVDFVDIKISWKVVFKISNYLFYFNYLPNALINSMLMVCYATRFTINGTLDTSFIRHERSECLINECLEKFIKELHTILFELTNFPMTFRKRNS
jgi:hypothetical protein